MVKILKKKDSFIYRFLIKNAKKGISHFQIIFNWKNSRVNWFPKLLKIVKFISSRASVIHTYFFTSLTEAKLTLVHFLHIASRWVIPCWILDAYLSLLFRFLLLFSEFSSSHNAIRLSRAKRGVQWHDPKTGKWSNMIRNELKNIHFWKNWAKLLRKYAIC